MQVSVVYIHHNCFVLTLPGRTLLFDYPEDVHLPDDGPDMVRRLVRGTDLTVFISHGHADHLNGDLASVTREAGSVRYVLSDDVEDMRPDAVPDNGEVLMVEPDEKYEFHDISIETLMANDLGVAFMVEVDGVRIYYGGDLAEWIWDSASEAEAEFTARFFRESLERVRAFEPHVAFSNVDKRLSNLAGGEEACRTIEAPLFVPMHTFGDLSALESFEVSVEDVETRVFRYLGPGSRISVSFPFTPVSDI